MTDALERSLNALCDEQPFHTGWYFRNLRTGKMLERHGEVVVPSASTRKIAIMMAALKAVNEGRLALDDAVVIQERFQNNDSGCFQHLQAGFTITLRDALFMMIIVSDNTCTGTVAELVGLDAVNRFSREVGMTGTAHRFGIPTIGMDGYLPSDQTNATTPADVGKLLELIVQGSDDADAAAKLGCTPELCRLALDILSSQKLRNRLPSRLPRGTKVAHKTGTTARNYNDAGIVYADGAPLFVLAAYTDQVPDILPDGLPGHTGAQLLIGRLCRLCYDAALGQGPS